VFVVLIVVGSLLYGLYVEREKAREKARTDKIIEQFQQRPAVMPSEAEPLQGGHYHGDEWHASEVGGHPTPTVTSGTQHYPLLLCPTTSPTDTNCLMPGRTSMPLGKMGEPIQIYRFATS